MGKEKKKRLLDVPLSRTVQPTVQTDTTRIKKIGT